MNVWRTRTGFGFRWLTDNCGGYVKLGWLCLAWKRDKDWPTILLLAALAYAALC